MNLQIAIISDDILFSNLFIPLLKRNIKDVQIQVCANPEEIDAKIDKQNCKLIIVDGGIQQMSSIELTEYTRSSARIYSPIWFFTEIITSSYLHKVQSIGANKIYHKPFDPYVVFDDILKLI